MNKTKIFGYILELETVLKTLLVNNPFSEVIIFEIITDAIMTIHDVDSSSFSDEKTAKSAIEMSISAFYNQKNFLKLEDKYRNWRERVTYGFKGRLSVTPDNLMRFRKAFDMTRKDVIREREALIYAVKNHIFQKESKKRSTSQTKFKWIVSAITIVAIVIAGMLILPAKCSGDKTTKTKETKTSLADVETVFVCTSPGAKAYHVSEDCMGLSNCSYEIEEISIEEAEDLDRRPCRMCIEY